MQIHFLQLFYNAHENNALQVHHKTSDSNKDILHQFENHNVDKMQQPKNISRKKIIKLQYTKAMSPYTVLYSCLEQTQQKEERKKSNFL